MKKIIAIVLASTLIFLTACTKMETTNNNAAVIKTSMGDITLRLFPDKTPETYKNFVTLAEEGKYDGVIFHRVMKDFMIQGGDIAKGDGTGHYSYKGEGTSFKDEFDPGLKHMKGALSMANSGPNSNGSQFFIVHAAEGTSWLDGKHSVFGQVYEGLDIVDKIASTEVGPDYLPTTEVIIKKIEIITKDFEK